MNDKDIVYQKKNERVGRHIAKKNAGQHPRKLNCHDINVSVTKNKQPDTLEEHIFEDDLFSPINEETVTTESDGLIENEDEIKTTFDRGKEERVKLKKTSAVRKGKLQANFECNVCNKTFPHRSHLIRHLNTHTGVKRYTCDQCSKQFSNSYNLSVHLFKHTGNFPLKCKICGKGVSCPSLMKRHMRVHTGALPFQCKYCLKQFGHSSSLQCHEKMHLHRPSYTCDICFKIFSYTNSLAAHKKTHSGLKAFHCNVCHKSFTRNTSLKRHMKCHDGSKTKCNYCDVTFTDSDFKVHLIKVHGKFKCDVCSVILNKSSWASHKKKHKLKK